MEEFAIQLTVAEAIEGLSAVLRHPRSTAVQRTEVRAQIESLREDTG